MGWSAAAVEGMRKLAASLYRLAVPLEYCIRPTETRGAAMGAVNGLTADGLFIGQSQEFFEFLRDLAEDADEAMRGF